MVETEFSVARTTPRFSFVAEAELIGQFDATRLTARISELSSRGCYVDMLNPIPLGTQVRLRIHYGSSTCELPGKVIYSHAGFGMGVGFGEMAMESRRILDAWLEELSRKPQ